MQPENLAHLINVEQFVCDLKQVKSTLDETDCSKPGMGFDVNAGLNMFQDMLADVENNCNKAIICNNKLCKTRVLTPYTTLGILKNIERNKALFKIT